QTVALLTTHLVALCACADSPPRPETSAPAAPGDFRSFIDEQRVALGLPGLAVVVAHADGVPEVAVSGVRRLGEPDALLPTDPMHLGSNGKALTSAAIAVLVE